MKTDNNLLSWEAAVLWLKAQPNAAALVRDCFFDDPLADAARRYHASTEWQAVSKLLPRARGTALDLGSGRGIAAFALARDGWHTTALEPDPSDVVGAGAIRALAAETRTHIEVAETWGESLPFENSAFDLVHVRQVLHHARDLRLLCSEIARVLKPGGRVIATREHVISRAADLNVFLGMHPLHHLYGGEHAFLLEEYVEALESAGIELTSVLNPWESDINLYPETIRSFKSALARKVGLRSAVLFPDVLLKWCGRLSRAPGRLYTFVGHLPGPSLPSDL